MSIELNSKASSRRTVVKGAAWSVPVIAAAIAAPASSASVVEPPLPPASFWGTGATASVVSGNVTNYTLEGTDSEGEAAALPMGSTVTVTPDAGVSLAIQSFTPGVLAVLNPDVTITLTVVGNDVTNVRLQFRPTGPSGSGYTITTLVDIDPFNEDIDVKIR